MSRPVASRLSWLLASAPRRPGHGRRRPPESRSQLLGHDLHDGLGAAGPGVLPEVACESGPDALGQEFGGMFGAVIGLMNNVGRDTTKVRLTGNLDQLPPWITGPSYPRRSQSN